MNPQRLWAITRKEFIHVLRDPLSLGMAIAIPIFLLFLYGYGLTLDVDRVPIVIWNQSQSPESRAFLSGFEGSRYFHCAAHITDYASIEHAMDTREAMAALVIPRDFAEDIHSGRSARVQMITDGSDSNTATIAIGYAESVARAFSQQVLLERLNRAGMTPPRQPIDVRARVWFNEDLESRNYIIPGLTAVIMSMIAALLTSLTIAREWERGTMEQLISTPVRSAELIFGKMIPYYVIGMVNMAIAVIMGVGAFNVPLRGGILFLIAAASLFLIGALAQGILISTLAKNQLKASMIAIFSTFLPAFLLSGFAFAIANMPLPLQWVTRVVAARYFVSLLKGIYLKGAGMTTLWQDTAWLMLFCAIMLALAITKFRKKML